MSSDERLKYVDSFRGVGILLMIMGHIGFGNKFIFFIHAFHMPMFYLVSGMFYNDPDNSVAYIMKKAKGLIVPYIVWSVIYILIYAALNRNLMGILTAIKAYLIVNTNLMPYGGALWFLVSLFEALVIYQFLSKNIKSKIVLNILIAVIALAATFLPRFVDFNIPFQVESALVGLGFIHIGRLLWSRIKTVECKLAYLIPLSALSVVLIFCNGYVSMRTNTYSNEMLFWLNAVFSSSIGLIWIKKISAKSRLFERNFGFLGRNSIVYLCMNQLVIYGVKNIYEIFANNSNSMMGWIVVLIASCTIISPFVFLLNTKYFRWFIGK